MLATREFTSGKRGSLDHDSVPMRLWRKAKKLGVWDPVDIDFSQDRRDWRSLNNDQQDVLLRLSSLFLAGEESVTLDLLPLMLVIAREGRLEEEMYLTSFLWEEAKHVELFQRFIDEVAGRSPDLERYQGKCYREIFHRRLPEALHRLLEDASPPAQAEASATYNLVVEGVLAETGYRGYHRCLAENGILPGMQKAVTLVKRDESRHLAYGVFLLSRLVAEHGDGVWQAIQERLSLLTGPALGVVQELFEPYPSMPFGLDLEDFTSYALSQFQGRIKKVEQARKSRGA